MLLRASRNLLPPALTNAGATDLLALPTRWRAACPSRVPDAFRAGWRPTPRSHYRPARAASAHGPGSDGSVPRKLPGGKPLSAGYHTYAVEWSPTHIQWLLDGVAYATYDRSQMPAGKKWVFDHPFFILLNVAVGGSWPGNPDATTRFPQRMEVDYVRVYRAAP